MTYALCAELRRALWRLRATPGFTAAAVLSAVLLLAAPRAAGAQAPTHPWRLVERVRIGAADDPDAALTEPGDIVVRDGEVFVTQPKDGQIRVYDAHGRFIRTLGRKGGGPGEFRGIDAAGVVGQGLFVADRHNARLTVLRRDGSVRSTFSAALERVRPPFLPTVPYAALRNGRLVVLPDFSRVYDDARVPLLAFDPTGALRDTLAWVELGTGNVVGDAKPGPGEGGVPIHFAGRRPITSESLWAPLGRGDGVVVVDRPIPEPGGRARFRLTLVRAHGDTALSRVYVADAVRLDPATADSLVDAMLAGFRSFLRPLAARAGQDPRKVEQAMRDAISLPPYYPAVRDLRVAGDSAAWLRLPPNGGPGEAWAVVSLRDGAVLGRVLQPAGVVLKAVSADGAWGVAHDSLDVAYVVGYTLVK